MDKFDTNHSAPGNTTIQDFKTAGEHRADFFCNLHNVCLNCLFAVNQEPIVTRIVR